MHYTYTYTSRRKRYRREKMIKITTPSQREARFEHSKPIKKKLRLLLEWQPFHHFSLIKGNRNFFSHFLQRVSGGFHQVFPVHSHRHWKERMHFHIWGLRAWPFFDGKLPGMVCLRTFQKPSTWPVWILTFPCSSGFFLQCTHLLLLT